MDILNLDDLLEGVTTMIDYLSTRSEEFYVALELMHQLRDELVQAIDNE